MPSPDTILPLIQFAITPVILISGLGSLVIAMTNRLGRIVDRTRLLATQARPTSGPERANLEAQIKIMFRRAKIMRWAMTLVVSSMFVSGVLIALLFASALLHATLAGVILAVFITSVTLMLGGLAAFIADVIVSLKALRVEVTKTLADIED
ncbi:DUF2721 domain-containing protein [Nibricoccus sp. IMCC34717]|uniref:DUF2721 domain-containing protein n=1 Tax=Nibricoccus sp. IMCC34717 TaxID=3034021 RepID=UPI00384D91B6